MTALARFVVVSSYGTPNARVVLVEDERHWAEHYVRYRTAEAERFTIHDWAHVIDESRVSASNNVPLKASAFGR